MTPPRRPAASARPSNSNGSSHATGNIGDGSPEAGARASHGTSLPGAPDRARPTVVPASAGPAQDRRPSRARTIAPDLRAITGPVATAAAATGSTDHVRGTASAPSRDRVPVADAPDRRPPPPPAESGRRAPAPEARGNPVRAPGTETGRGDEVALAASRTQSEEGRPLLRLVQGHAAAAGRVAARGVHAGGRGLMFPGAGDEADRGRGIAVENRDPSRAIATVRSRHIGTGIEPCFEPRLYVHSF